VRDRTLRTPSMEMPPGNLERCQTIGKWNWEATSRSLSSPSAGPCDLLIEVQRGSGTNAASKDFPEKSLKPTNAHSERAGRPYASPPHPNGRRIVSGSLLGERAGVRPWRRERHGAAKHWLPLLGERAGVRGRLIREGQLPRMKARRQTLSPEALGTARPSPQPSPFGRASHFLAARRFSPGPWYLWETEPFFWLRNASPPAHGISWRVNGKSAAQEPFSEPGAAGAARPAVEGSRSKTRSPGAGPPSRASTGPPRP